MKKLLLLFISSAVILSGCCASGNYVQKEKPKKSVLKTEKTAEGTKITLKGDVSFDTMSADLNDKAGKELDDLGKKMVKEKVRYVKIVGHTDSRGTDAYNNVLSRDRAETVRLRLKAQGVKTSQMEAHGMGSKQPIATNDTDEGRAKNRRVEIFIKE